MAWPLIVAAAIGATQTGIGLYKQWKGKQEYNELLKNVPMYKYETPSYVKEAISVAGQGYAAGAPTYGLMEQRIGASTSRALRAGERLAGSGQDLQSAAEAAYAKELDALNQLAMSDMQYRDQARGQYLSALTVAGQMEDAGKRAEFEQKFALWQMKANRALGGAGFGGQMAMSGLSSAAGAITSYLGTRSNMSQLQSLFEQKNTQASSSSIASLGGYNMNRGYNMYDPSTWGRKNPDFSFKGDINTPYYQLIR